MPFWSFLLCLFLWAPHFSSAKPDQSRLVQEAWLRGINDIWEEDTQYDLRLHEEALHFERSPEFLVGAKKKKKEKKKEGNEKLEFQKQEKLWNKHSRAIVNVAHAAVETSDLVPAVRDGLKRVTAIIGLVNLVSDVLDDVNGLDTRAVRPPLSKLANQMDDLREKMLDLSTLVPKVGTTIAKMAHWMTHALSLTQHILNKLLRFADFQEVWDKKISKWYIAKGGEGAEQVDESANFAFHAVAGMLKMVNDRISEIKGMLVFKKGHETYIDMADKLEDVENRVSKFLNLLRTKSVSVLLPHERCLEKKTDQVKEINEYLDTLEGLKESSRRRMGIDWSWEDLDFHDDALSESKLSEPDFSNPSRWSWSDLDDVERGLAVQDHTEKEKDPELRKLVKRFKHKVKQKMKWENIDQDDCVQPRLERHTLVDLLATAESIQKFGAFNVLRAVFIPMFKEAGIWGGVDAPLIGLSKAIVDGRDSQVTRFSTGTFANVLVNVETIAGKTCGIMAMGAERVHELSVLISTLNKRAAVLNPPKEVTIFLETARGLFDSTKIVNMMSTFFKHCKAPDLSPSESLPSKKKPCDDKAEIQPFDVPDGEKGTPEEKGVLKVPKVAGVSDSDDGEAVADSEEEGAYVDIGIAAENKDYLADSEEKSVTANERMYEDIGTPASADDYFEHLP